MVIKVNRSGGGSRYPSGYTDLNDHGLIGNMRTAALISVSGTIAHLCLPYFDSPSVFARLLDKNHGGHFSVTTKELTSSKQMYVPSTNILATKFLSNQGVGQITDFMPLPSSSSESEHRFLPWIVRKVEVIRGTLNFHVECAPAFNYARSTHSTRIIPPTTSKHSNNSTTPHNCSASASDNPVVQFDCEEHLNLDLRFVTSNGTIKDQAAPVVELDYLDLSERGHKGLGVAYEFRLTEGQSVTFVMREPPKRATVVNNLICQAEEIELEPTFSRGISDLTSEEDPILTRNLTESLFSHTQRFWLRWVSKSSYKGRWREFVQRSALAIKLLTFSPTGAIIAAPTFSLPEDLSDNQAGRNWDYRYAWLRDSSFSVYALLRLGFTEESDQYVNWLSGLLKDRNEDGSLQIMYTIFGKKDIPELELPHLDGHKGQKPVRIGNGASSHLQLDIYGELLDAIYLSQKFSKPLSWEMWLCVRVLVDFVCTAWDQPDLSIWEVRGERQNFLYSKIMCWVALDRGLRLADKRSLPAPNRDHWLKTRDKIYEEIQTRGWNAKGKFFSQSYESPNVLDSAVLIMPLVFFGSASDPRFLSTLKAIMATRENDGLCENGLVYRYDTSKVDDGTGGGEEGAFSMCTLWAIEAMSRTGDPLLLSKAVNLLEDYMGYSNHLDLFSEEISKGGESLGNFPQAFSHTSLISTCFNVDRAITAMKR